MEKEAQNSGRLKRILVTGPESSGKTALVNRLAGRFGGIALPEYARGYIEQLGRPYTFEDVEHIAMQQVREYDLDHEGEKWLFFDTWLLITKVWFDQVYGGHPDWLDDRISQAGFDLVLLCAPDIPWVPDPVRENGGAQREVLFDRYKEELDRYSMNWEVVTGTGDERIHRAEQIILKRFQNGAI